MQGELSVVSDGNWPLTSGAAALEEMARATVPPYGVTEPILRGEPLADMIQALGELRERREVVAAADTSGGDGFRASLMRRFLGRQQVFNDAVVRAFQAQDRVNRELTAQILLTMLDLAWRDARRQAP